MAVILTFLTTWIFLRVKNMDYRYLGKSGLNISSLSFGSWINFGTKIQQADAVDLIKLAYSNGVNFFDNAESYQKGLSEIIMGNALKKLGFSRDSFCISSKVFWGGDLPTQRGLSAKHIRDACHNSLKRLQVDYLDLFFCHRPDINTPIEETVWAMNNLIQQGKILYWGTSEWSASQIIRAIEFANNHHLIAPTMEQPKYNMLHRNKLEDEYLSLFKYYKYGTTIWSPLASGLLTGKYNSGVPKDSRLAMPEYTNMKKQFLESEEGKKNIQQIKSLTKIAQSLGCSLSQMAIAWCLLNPNVSTVILGASNTLQLQENLLAINFVEKIDNTILQEIESILDPSESNKT